MFCLWALCNTTLIWQSFILKWHIMLSACNIAAQSSQMSPVIRGLKWHFVGSCVVDTMTEWHYLVINCLEVTGHSVRVYWTSLSTPHEKLSIQSNKDLLHVWFTVLLHKDKTYLVLFSSLVMKQRLTNRLFSNTTDHLTVSVSSLNSLVFQECYQTMLILWCHHNCLLWMWCIPST